MFIEQLMGRLLSKVGEPDRDLAPIFKPEVASNEPIALKSVDKAGSRRPGYASTLRQLMRGQAVRLPMKEKQKDRFAFGQAIGGEPRRAILSIAPASANVSKQPRRLSTEATPRPRLPQQGQVLCSNILIRRLIVRHLIKVNDPAYGALQPHNPRCRPNCHDTEPP